MADKIKLTREELYVAKLGEHLITPKTRLYDARYIPSYEVLFCPNLADHPLLRDKLGLDAFKENILTSWNFRECPKLVEPEEDGIWTLTDRTTQQTYDCDMTDGYLQYPVHSLNFKGDMEVDTGLTLSSMGGGLAFTGDMRGITIQVGEHYLFYYPSYANWRKSGEEYDISDGTDVNTCILSGVGGEYFFSTSENHHFKLDFDAGAPITLMADYAEFSLNRIIQFKNCPYDPLTIVPGQPTQGVMYSDEFFRMLEIDYLPPMSNRATWPSDYSGDRQDSVRGGWVCDIPHEWMDDELLARYPTFMKQRYLPPGWNE